MQTTVATSVSKAPKNKARQISFSDFDSEKDEVHIRGWSHGCGTPFPDVPLSQRRYGIQPFEDGEPWM